MPQQVLLMRIFCKREGLDIRNCDTRVMVGLERKDSYIFMLLR